MIVTSLDRDTEPCSAKNFDYTQFEIKLDSQKFSALSAYNIMDMYQFLSNFSHSKDRGDFVSGPAPLISVSTW